jgi:magnesium chelatase family protein
MLVAAMNPCPCSYYGDPIRECSCTAPSIMRYQKRISGPLLDSIDIHVEVPSIDYEKLADKRKAEDSATIRARPGGTRTPAPALGWHAADLQCRDGASLGS